MIKKAYKSAGNNLPMTLSLFGDVYGHDNKTPPFWLNKHPEGAAHLCWRNIFVSSEDPTGYELAQRTVGWDHFQYLVKHCGWFRESLDLWKKELADRLLSKSFLKIVDIVSDSEAPATTTLSAAKWLNDALKPTEPIRGRPSKAEIKGALKEKVDADEETLSDLERISERFN